MTCHGCTGGGRLNFELTALGTFAFVSAMTPGPNNLMLMASGVNYGFRRSVPHMLGVLVGFVVMFVLVGVGLMQVFAVLPGSYRVLKGAGVIYLVFLAWKIATAVGPGKALEPGGKPLTFIQAALFQWVNPKAWIVAVTAVTVYAPSSKLPATLLVAAVFGVVTVPSVTVWTLLGRQFRHLLTDTVKLRVFNGVMAVLLVLSLVPALVPW